MILLIDMDNVVADLMKKWLGSYNSTHNDILTADQVTTWQIESHASKCSPQEFHDLIGQPHFFADLDVLPDAVEVTKRLQQAGHELYFVTATPYANPTAGHDKYNWVDKHFPHIGKARVIQAYHKFMIRGDLLFDDGPRNLSEFHGLKVAMDFPYNRNVSVDHRVNNWLEFEKIIEKIKA